MSVQSEIDRINEAVSTQTDLIAQITTTLEGKVAGSGGGSGDSSGYCTINVSSENSWCFAFYQGENGWTGSGEESQYSITVRCGSIVVVSQNGYYGATVSDGEVIHEEHLWGFVYQAPSTPDTVVTMAIQID